MPLFPPLPPFLSIFRSTFSAAWNLVPGPLRWVLQTGRSLVPWTAMSVVTIVYMAPLVPLYLLQRKLLYVPKIPGMTMGSEAGGQWFADSPGSYNLHFMEADFLSEPGVKIHGWLLYNPQGNKQAPTILWCQSNAGDISHRLENANVMIKTLNCNIFLLSYRGYGPSQGQPTQEGLTRDAKAALGFLLAEPSIDNSKIFVFGRSLGGAVAIQLASDSYRLTKKPSEMSSASSHPPLAGLILENTFTSVKDIALHMMPFLSIYLGWSRHVGDAVIRDKWNSIDAIKNIKCPILLISSKRDKMIPPEQMMRLYNSVPDREAARLLCIDNAGHMDAWMVNGGLRGLGEYWEAIKEFISR